MNYRIKQNDYQNKQTFYRAEEILDKLKASLVPDVSAAFEYAYVMTTRQYASKSADERTAYYRKCFTEYLDKLWKKTDEQDDKYIKNHAKVAGGDWTAAVIAHYDGFYDTTDGNIYIVSGDGMEEAGEDGTAPDDGLGIRGRIVPSSDDDSVTGQYILENVTVRYVANGYVTYIRTNIVLSAPDYNWGLGEAVGGAEDSTQPEEAESDDNVLRMADSVIYTNWRKY